MQTHLLRHGLIRPSRADLTISCLLITLVVCGMMFLPLISEASRQDQVFNAEFNQAFVAMQYYGYLRRAPETAGYNAWLTYLNANPTDSRTMVSGFMNSLEYRLRFGP
jgi:hypothetical protein